jgi:hypothetical protein
MENAVKYVDGCHVFFPTVVFPTLQLSRIYNIPDLSNKSTIFPAFEKCFQANLKQFLMTITWPWSEGRRRSGI